TVGDDLVDGRRVRQLGSGRDIQSTSIHQPGRQIGANCVLNSKARASTFISRRQPTQDFAETNATPLCLKSPESFLDTVSTGSGSDLVSDQHAIFLALLDFIV